MSRKLIRDVYFSARPHSTLLVQFQRGFASRLWSNGNLLRQFSVLKEFTERIKREVNENEDFQKTVKEFKDKAEELKAAKDDLKTRTKQKTEELYKHVDEAWTEAELNAKKASSSVKEKLSAAKKEAEETFGSWKQETESTSGSTSKDDPKEEGNQNENEETISGKWKEKFPSEKIFVAYEKMKEAKVVDMVKKGYDVLKDELHGSPTKRKHLEYSETPFKGELSSKKDVVFAPTKQTAWQKRWGSFVEKVRGNPVVKKIVGISEPVVTKSQEVAEDMRDRWETSDNPIVHKIQDVGDTIFQESDTASTMKEIRRRDPSFSLPDFVAEVQSATRPVLNAYLKGDVETLKKYCTPEVISRYEAEKKAYESHGIFIDNKILHISEVEVRETKMMGNSPLIIVAFQSQQVHCVRDRNGAITEGGKDTIHTVYYGWAMQQLEAEDTLYPIWKLREVQQLGVQTLI